MATAKSPATIRETAERLISRYQRSRNHVAVLDDAGEILAVNPAWSAFGRANALNDPDSAVGSNYIAECALASDDPHALTALRALNMVCHRTKTAEHFVYPCHGPEQKRWFICEVRRDFQTDLVLVLHHSSDAGNTAQAAIERAQHIIARSREMRAQSMDAVGDAQAAYLGLENERKRDKK